MLLIMLIMFTAFMIPVHAALNYLEMSYSLVRCGTIHKLKKTLMTTTLSQSLILTQLLIPVSYTHLTLPTIA